MSSQVEQHNTQRDQNPGMRPTNNQVGGPGEFGSNPAQHDNKSRFDGQSSASSGDQYNVSQQQGTQQQQIQPPPVHPSRVDQSNQFGEGYGQAPGQNQNVPSGPGGAQNQFADRNQDQYPNQNQQGVPHNGTAGRATHSVDNSGYAGDSGRYDQNVNQNQPHTLDRRGHRGPGAKAHAAEGERVAHGGHHDEAHNAQHQQNDFGTGPGQNGQFATHQGQGTTGGTTGHHAGSTPVRAAEAGATYEAGKLAHGDNHGRGQHGERFTPDVTSGNRTGYATGQGAEATGTDTAAAFATPNVGQTGQSQQHTTGVGAGTAATAGGVAGAAHPGVGHGADAYNQQPTGATATGAPGAHTGFTGATGATGPATTTTASGASGAAPGTTSGPGGITGPSVASGQANVILGKLQQAGGMLLRDDTMKAKGLEREARGVAKADRNEATRLEDKAQARRQKAYGTTAPASANAGVDPTVGTHGRNL